MFKKLIESYKGIWNNLSRWKKICFFVFHYTVLFVILQQFVFYPFFKGEKTFLWKTDGPPIYFTSAVYVSKTIRQGIKSLLSGNGWSFPLYDFHLGPAKLVSVLIYSDWMIPLLSIFCPWDKIDILFDILVIFRYYLVGLSFSAYGFHLKCKPLPILTGSISYMFCGWMLYAGLRDNSFFVGPAILFPLAFIAIDNVIKGKSITLLTILIFVAFSFQIYFSYMMFTILVLYIFLRLLDFYKQKQGELFIRVSIRLFVSFGVGILLSAVVLIPTLIDVLGTGRVGRNVAEFTNLFHYASNYYHQFVSEYLLGPTQFYSDTYLGFSVLVIPCILALFIQRNPHERWIRIMYLVTTLMMLLPFAAYTMSAFNSIKNRWGYMYAFVACVILMLKINDFEIIEKKSLIYVSLGTVFYFFICYFFISHKYYREERFVLLGLTILVIVVLMKLPNCKTIIPLFCLSITIFSVLCSAHILYDPSERNFVSEFVDKGMLYESYSQSQYSSFSKSLYADADKTLYRVAKDNLSTDEINASFYYGINGLTAYSSFVYSGYSDWIREMELARGMSMHRYFGLRSRAPMLTLAGVKYYVQRETGNQIIPYGFEKVDRIQNDNNTDWILENKYALPFGYTYDTYLLDEQYEVLPAIEKQIAQVRAIILKELPEFSNIKEGDFVKTATKIPIEIKNMENITWDNSSLIILEKGAEITLSFQGIPNSETYLRIVNLDLTDGASSTRWSVQAKTENTKTDARFSAEGYLYDHGMKTQLLDLGFSEEGYTSCKIIFPQKGTYILDDLEVWCQDMSSYQSSVSLLKEESLEDIQANWRGVTGNIFVSRDKMLCFSIPYDKGWTAYVDGKKARLYQANTAFMAVELSAGDHIIELKYWTPGLTLGIILSLIGGGVFIFICVWNIKNKS